MAEAVAETRTREECAHAPGGAVETIDQDSPDPIRGLLLGRGALELPIGLGKGCRTGLLRVAQMPDDPAADHRGQIDFGGETAAMLFIRQKIGGQGQPTPRQHRHQPLVAKRTHQAIEGHGGDMADHRAQFHTEATMRGQQGITGHVWPHSAIAQDKVGEDREHHTTRGALETPDGDPPRRTRT